MAIVYYPKNSFLLRRDTVSSSYEEVVLSAAPNTILYFGASGSVDEISASSIAITSSWALTASYALNGGSGGGGGSGGTNLETGSTYPITSSWALNSISASYSPSSAQKGLETGSSYPITSSWATNSISSSYWNSSSVATRIDTLFTNKQNNIATGSLVPITSSWANNSISASYAPFADTGGLATGSTYPITSSWSTNSISASYWNSSSVAARIDTLFTNKQNNIATGSIIPITASWTLNAPQQAGTMSTGSTYPITSSWAINSISASYAPFVDTGGLATGSTYPITSSWTINSISSWYWNSSSVAVRIDTLYTNKQNNIATGSTLPITSSWTLNAISASYAPFVQSGLATGSSYPITSSWSNNSFTASYISSSFSRGGTFFNSSGLTQSGSVYVWEAPFSCSVFSVKGIRSNGTGAQVNARRNGVGSLVPTDISLTGANAWLSGSTIQSSSFNPGDILEIQLNSITGSVTQVGIQVNFRK